MQPWFMFLISSKHPYSKASSMLSEKELCKLIPFFVRENHLSRKSGIKHLK